jgi:hypothetical protein
MSNHENTVNRTIDGDSAEGHLKLPNGETEVHQRQLDDAAEGHKRTNLDDETEGHAHRQIGEPEVNRRI